MKRFTVLTVFAGLLACNGSTVVSPTPKDLPPDVSPAPPDLPSDPLDATSDGLEPGSVEESVAKEYSINNSGDSDTKFMIVTMTFPSGASSFEPRFEYTEFHMPNDKNEYETEVKIDLVIDSGDCLAISSNPLGDGCSEVNGCKKEDGIHVTDIKANSSISNESSRYKCPDNEANQAIVVVGPLSGEWSIYHDKGGDVIIKEEQVLWRSLELCSKEYRLNGLRLHTVLNMDVNGCPCNSIDPGSRKPPCVLKAHAFGVPCVSGEEHHGESDVNYSYIGGDNDANPFNDLELDAEDCPAESQQFPLIDGKVLRGFASALKALDRSKISKMYHRSVRPNDVELRRLLDLVDEGLLLALLKAKRAPVVPSGLLAKVYGTDGLKGVPVVVYRFGDRGRVVFVKDGDWYIYLFESGR